MSEPVEKALGFLCTPSAEHMSDGQRIDDFCHVGRKAVGEITIMRAMLAANEAEIARLREALKPFAEQYDAVEKEFGMLLLPDDANSMVRYADLRAARAAMGESDV